MVQRCKKGMKEVPLGVTSVPGTLCNPSSRLLSVSLSLFFFFPWVLGAGAGQRNGWDDSMKGVVRFGWDNSMGLRGSIRI